MSKSKLIEGLFIVAATMISVLEHWNRWSKPLLPERFIMARKDRSHYAKKYEAGAVVDPMLRDALLKSAAEGKLACKVAFDVANRLGVLPDAVGRAADILELRLVECQLGLFDHPPKRRDGKPAESVAPEMKKAILTGLVNERLPCKTAWEIAEQLGIKKVEAGAACDAIGIRIKPCQLGAF